MTVTIARAPGDFSEWDGLLGLLLAAFAPMTGRIDPPSSVLRLTPATLAEKAGDETLILATEDGVLIGCVFARRQPDSLYVGKLAVTPDRQGEGIGRRLMAAVEALAVELGLPAVELETRIELTENHATFAAMGYAKIGETAHPGFDRPTSITMRKTLAAPSWP